MESMRSVLEYWVRMFFALASASSVAFLTAGPTSSTARRTGSASGDGRGSSVRLPRCNRAKRASDIAAVVAMHTMYSRSWRTFDGAIARRE